MISPLHSRSKVRNFSIVYNSILVTKVIAVLNQIEFMICDINIKPSTLSQHSTNSPFNELNQENQTHTPNVNEFQLKRILPHATLHNLKSPNRQENEQSLQQNVITTPQHSQLSFQQSQLMSMRDQVRAKFLVYHECAAVIVAAYLSTRVKDIMGKYELHVAHRAEFKDIKRYLNIHKHIFFKMYELAQLTRHSTITMETVVGFYPGAIDPGVLPVLKTCYRNVEDGMCILEDQYSQRSQLSDQRVQIQLRNLAELSWNYEFEHPTLLYFWGFMVLLMGISTLLLLRNFNINFDSSPNFELTFPIWRSQFCIVFFIWMLGINGYIFNSYGVNFNLLTTFDNYHLPSPAALLIVAAVFTTTSLFLFLIYIIKLTDVGMSRILNNHQLQLLPGISLSLYLCFLFLPLPICGHRQRLYPLAMTMRSIISPFIGVDFKFHWWVQLLMSVRQTIRDIGYSLNYYFINRSIQFQQTLHYETGTGIFIFGLRFLQILRQIWQSKQCPLQLRHAIGRTLANILTITASHLSRTQSDEYYIYLWICCAVFNTLYSSYIDLKQDWALLDPKYQFLRPTLLYHNKKFYYGAMILDVILRGLWVINLSPDIIVRLNIKPYVLTMILAFLEITRRAIWNLFRLEREHLCTEAQLNNIFQIERETLNIQTDLTQKDAKSDKTLDENVNEASHNNLIGKSSTGFPVGIKIDNAFQGTSYIEPKVIKPSHRASEFVRRQSSQQNNQKMSSLLTSENLIKSTLDSKGATDTLNEELKDDTLVSSEMSSKIASNIKSKFASKGSLVFTEDDFRESYDQLKKYKDGVEEIVRRYEVFSAKINSKLRKKKIAFAS